MYAIYAYIGVVLGVNVGIYGIHGVSGSCFLSHTKPIFSVAWAIPARNHHGCCVGGLATVTCHGPQKPKGTSWRVLVGACLNNVDM